MGEYDTWRATMASRGSSKANAIENQTIQFINNKFEDSPMYMNIPINGIGTDVRLLRDMDADDPTMKRFLLRPSSSVTKGAYAVIYSDNWLVNMVDEHPYYPTAHIMHCTDNLRWYLSDNVTQKQYPCVIQGMAKAVQDKANQFLEVAAYEIHILAQYNSDTQTINSGMRFILGKESVYEVIGFDAVSNVYDGNGYIEFGAKLVTANPQDNFTTLFADNSAYYLQFKNKAGGGITW